jgi:predicted permease
MVLPQLIELVVRHLVFAMRRFRRSPGFFLVAVVLIATGIATATTIFALVNAILLRPLPVRNPDNLVQLFQIFASNLRPQGYFSYELYRQLSDNASPLFDVAGQSETSVALDTGAGPERAYVQMVTDNFFSALGVDAVLGATTTSTEAPVAVLSEFGWQKYFRRDPNVLGRVVRLNGRPFQIIGVTPQGFNGINVDISPALRVSYRFVAQLNGPDDDFLEIIARLKAGIPRIDAEKRVTEIWKSLPEPMPGSFGNSRLELRSAKYGASYLRDQFRIALIVLMAGSGLLLMIVCANVGGLLLARSAAHAKETALCVALGASRTRIARECLTESFLLSLAGTAAGAGAVAATLPLLVRWMPELPLTGWDLRTFAIDIKTSEFAVVGFVAFCCCATATLSGVVPAWNSSRRDLQLLLKQTTGDVGHHRLQSLLCAFQIAICMVLIVSAGLMERTLSNMHSLNLGFDAQNVVAFSIDPRLANYDSGQVWEFQQRLIREVQPMPGIEAAALAGMPLMRGIGIITTMAVPGETGQLTNLNFVTADYFDVLKMRIVAGRKFAPSEMPDMKPVPIVVNEEFVRRFLGARNPLGARLGRNGENEIVGVVEDSYYRSLRETPPAIAYMMGFGPQRLPGAFVLYVRTRTSPSTVIEPLRKLMRSIDPAVPVYDASTLAAEVQRSLWRERLVVGLSRSFAGFALALSAIGLYGVLAYCVAQRKREIGIRLALGAPALDVTWTVFKRICAVLIVGIAAGLAIYAIAAHWLTALLFGVKFIDPLVLSGSLLLVLIMTVAAAGAPVYRALQIDPASTLKSE